jgi:hypothetical protein
MLGVSTSVCGARGCVMVIGELNSNKTDCCLYRVYLYWSIIRIHRERETANVHVLIMMYYNSPSRSLALMQVN